jgi:hypothetical protein
MAMVRCPGEGRPSGGDDEEIGCYRDRRPLLLACTFVAQAQEKVSDGVVKIGMLEDISSIYADITGIGAGDCCGVGTNVVRLPDKEERYGN